MVLEREAGARRSRAGIARILAAATVVLLPAAARAEPSAQERAAAEALFQDARKLALDHRLDEACSKFAESQRLDPRPGTLMYLATCHAEQGKTATAWVEFTDAAAMAQRAGQREREAQARERAADLSARLSKLVLRVEGSASDLAVRVGGREMRSFGTALPFDPGPLTIEASAPGRKPWSQAIQIGKGPSEITVIIPALAPLPAAAPVMPAQPPPDAPPSAPDRTPGWITAGALGAVGIAGVVTGSVFGLRARKQYDDANRYCEGRYCTQPGLDGHADASRSALISTIAFGVAGASLVAGTIVAVITARAPGKPRTQAVRLEIGPGPALTVGGAF